MRFEFNGSCKWRSVWDSNPRNPFELYSLAGCCISSLPTLRNVAPEAGLEPATARLTAACSTIELFRKKDVPVACIGSNTIVERQNMYMYLSSKRERLWRRQQDSNLRTLSRQRFSRPPHSTALPCPRVRLVKILFLKKINGALCWIRTNDTRIRSPVLYPAELIAQCSKLVSVIAVQASVKHASYFVPRYASFLATRFL